MLVLRRCRAASASVRCLQARALDWRAMVCARPDRSTAGGATAARVGVHTSTLTTSGRWSPGSRQLGPSHTGASLIERMSANLRARCGWRCARCLLAFHRVLPVKGSARAGGSSEAGHGLLPAQARCPRKMSPYLLKCGMFTSRCDDREGHAEWVHLSRESGCSDARKGPTSQPVP